MTPYLRLTGTIFGVAGGMHLWALVREGAAPTSSLEFIVENGVLGAMGLGLAFWAFRLTQGRKSAR